MQTFEMLKSADEVVGRVARLGGLGGGLAILLPVFLCIGELLSCRRVAFVIPLRCARETDCFFTRRLPRGSLLKSFLEDCCCVCYFFFLFFLKLSKTASSPPHERFPPHRLFCFHHSVLCHLVLGSRNFRRRRSRLGRGRWTLSGQQEARRHDSRSSAEQRAARPSYDVPRCGVHRVRLED